MAWTLWGKKGKGEIKKLISEEKEVSRKEIKIVEQARREFILTREGIGRSQTSLANALIYTKKLEKLAQRLESDLLDMRNGSKDNRLVVLSNDELRVIDYVKDIKYRIQSIIEDMGGIEKEGHESHDWARTTAPGIPYKLAALHENLVELFALEEAVEKLMEEWVNQ